MDAKSYCESLGHELTGWKAKLYDTIRKAGPLQDDQKSEAHQLITELNTVIDDLNDRIARLASECPADFSSDRREIEGHFIKLKDGWKKIYGMMGEEEYGIGGA